MELEACIDHLTQQLYDRFIEDGAHGYWTGRLSSSALSTALACLALSVSDASARQINIKQGLDYLIQQQLPGGSWGDTDNSPGNISTTLLVWSALRFAARSDDQDAVTLAELWITEQVGSLEPRAIQEHIESCYGKDKTFSVPILMACCIAGCLGNGRSAWKLVKQLPFELAFFPQSFYAALRLPVVSYALPALIAIGHLRHCKAPTWFFPLRWFRGLVKRRCLRKLKRIQPENGGFLEATPLSAFVAMALSTAGLSQSETCKNANHFLLASQRDDGSWPIDTNLATWVTSLSVHALGDEELNLVKKDSLQAWYRSQQLQKQHPYTGAQAGGWAWTNLPGAVPDADDTSGALIALHKLGCVDMDVIEPGIQWLLSLQNTDGGMPTFCRGWANLPFDKSCADISAHGLRALCLWHDKCHVRLQRKITRTKKRLSRFLINAQQSRGEWFPLWFGNQDHPQKLNPVFGTARVLHALQMAGFDDRAVLNPAIDYLIDAQHVEGSWGAAEGLPASVEETALALEALSSVRTTACNDSCDRAASWLCEQWNGTVAAQPIGLYFASLWYYEDHYPICFSLAALRAYQQRKDISDDVT